MAATTTKKKRGFRPALDSKATAEMIKARAEASERALEERLALGKLPQFEKLA